MENTRTLPAYRPSSASPRLRHAVFSLVRGQAQDPAWARPALIGLLGITGLLYLWNLAASGWANAYYSAAVLAGTKSWAAFFFGSLDASNFITVDKAPGALWVMEISARLFGFSAWSVLAPQALEGVATVAIVYLAVRRWFGPAAGLLAGAVVALTPVAGLMFRFNNPDALVVLLITAATYATLRAIENGRTRWLVLAGALIGGGFLAKELQAFIIIPVLAGVYLLAGRPSLGRRIAQVLAAAVAVIVSSGWWIAAVELIPSASRPYIGGSQNNDLISLIFGYNGFGRLTGNESGSIGGLGALGLRLAQSLIQLRSQFADGRAGRRSRGCGVDRHRPLESVAEHRAGDRRAGCRGGARRTGGVYLRHRHNGAHWRDPLSGTGGCDCRRTGWRVARWRRRWASRRPWRRIGGRLPRSLPRRRPEFGLWWRRKSRRKPRWWRGTPGQ